MHPSLPDFSTGRVLVVGDVMLDRYWHGSTTRISPEAPVPVVKVEGDDFRAGGAGNVAFPDSLKGRYQSVTEADMGALRAAGYTHALMPVESSVPRYLERLATRSA